MIFLLLMLSVEPPSFTCNAHGRLFTCEAKNVGVMWPNWTLYKERGNYEASGPRFRYYAPKKWSVIEMRVSDEKAAWSLKADVRLEKNKAVFRPHKEKE